MHKLNYYENKVFKLWELDVPFQRNDEYGSEDILDNINFHVNLDIPFNKDDNSVKNDNSDN